MPSSHAHPLDDRLLKLKDFALNRVREAAYLIDANARFVYVNDEASRALGYAVDELLAMSVMDIDPEWSYERWVVAWGALKAEDVLMVDTVHRRKDGSLIPVEISATSFDFNNENYGLCLARDVTQKQQLERRLAMRDFVLDRVHEGFFVSDSDFRILQVNAEACRALGYSREELLSMTLFDIDPDLTAETVREWKDRGMGTPGTSSMLERRHRAKDGRIFPVEIASSLTTYGEKSVAISLARDITSRKRNERERRLLDTAVNASLDAAFLMNEQGTFIYVNEAACASLGYSRAELLTMSPLDIDPDLTPAQFAGLMQSMLAHRTKATIESRHRTRDGRIFPVELSASYLEVDAEKFCLVIARNIAERKRTEDALRFIAQRGWAAGGAESFHVALARYLGEVLDVAYVIIARLTEEPGMAETAAVCARGEIVPNMRYALDGTPCANVMGDTLCTYRSGIQALFPLDVQLVEMGAESYMGIPLWDSQGRALGLIALLDDKPLENEASAAALLRLVAVRAGSEMERERHERRLRESEQGFRSLAESSPDSIVRYDREGRIRYLNAHLMGQLKLGAQKEVLGKLPSEAWPDGRFADIQKAAARAVETGQTIRVDVIVPIPGAQPRHHQIVVAPERDDEGKVVGTLAFGRDVTDIREAELRLRHMIDSLPGFAYTFRLSPDGHASFPYVSSGIRDLYGLNPEDVRHDFRPLHDLAHPDDRPRIEAAMVESAGTLTSCQFESRICRPGLPMRWQDVRSVPERQPDGSTVWYGMMLDVTERKRAEKAREEHLRFLEAMDRVNRIIQAADDADSMLAAIIGALLDTFDCDRAFLVSPCDPDASSWTTRVECNRPEYAGLLTRGRAVPMDGEIAEAMRALLETEAPIAFGTQAGAQRPIPAGHTDKFGTRSMMAMALRPKTGSAWLFGIHQFSHARVWEPQERRLFQEIGRRLADGLAILLSHRELQDKERRLRESNAQLRELTARRETAREEERKRIAREIHDELGQNLTALRMGISQLRFQFGAEHPALAQHVGGMHQLAVDTIQSVRHIAGALRPAALEAGIAAALAGLASEFQSHTRIPCRVTHPSMPIRIDEGRALALFRIAQESLTNVARHAEARRVDIALSAGDGDCVIEIRDDGKGFDPRSSAETRSFGLIGMRERAGMAGGTIEIESAPGYGTTVAVRIPLCDRKEEIS